MHKYRYIHNVYDIYIYIFIHDIFDMCIYNIYVYIIYILTEININLYIYIYIYIMNFSLQAIIWFLLNPWWFSRLVLNSPRVWNNSVLETRKLWLFCRKRPHLAFFSFGSSWNKLPGMSCFYFF